MSNKIISIQNTALRLNVKNPFILAAHHHDLYPHGNAQMEPEFYLDGRTPGSDFAPKLPWHMYHGDKIPGFPVHPHRGLKPLPLLKKDLLIIQISWCFWPLWRW